MKRTLPVPIVVACPFCRAEQGALCVTSTSGKRLGYWHRERVARRNRLYCNKPFLSVAT